MGTTKQIVVVIVALLLLIGIGWGLKAALLPAKTVTTQIDSAGDIIKKTYDAENAIYNYEWFKQQHQDIEAQLKIISATGKSLDSYSMYGDPVDWDWQTKQDYNSLNSKYLGQQVYYETLVADYNARASMANRNIFVDGLPLNVEKILW